MHQSLLKIPGVLSRCVTFIIVLLHKKSIESVSVQKNTNEVKYADENEAGVTVLCQSKISIALGEQFSFSRGDGHTKKKIYGGFIQVFS